MSKMINIMVTFNNGSVKPARAEVDKSKYTSLQSKASTYKKHLNSGILTKQFTAEEAQELWNKNVCDKWATMVKEPFMTGLPDEVKNSIVNIAPEGNLLGYEPVGIAETVDAQ